MARVRHRVLEPKFGLTLIAVMREYERLALLSCTDAELLQLSAVSQILDCIEHVLLRTASPSNPKNWRKEPYRLSAMIIDGEPAGLLLLARRQNSLHIDALMTAPWNVKRIDPASGRPPAKRKGVGALGLEEAVRVSARCGFLGKVHLITLDAHSTAFYERYGFEIIPGSKRAMRLDPRTAPRWMARYPEIIPDSSGTFPVDLNSLLAP